MTNNNVVSFRSNEVKNQLLLRGGSAGAVAERDLDRYYTLLKLALYRVREQINFTEGEVGALCDYFNGLLFTVELEARQQLGDILLTEDSEYYESKWEIDFGNLEYKLNRLTELQAIAVIDAIERFWQQSDREQIKDFKSGFIEVGLIKPQAKGKSKLSFELEFESAGDAQIVANALNQTLSQVVSERGIEGQFSFDSNL